MDNEFVRVDLHIHTPASKNCYKGSKDDLEYYNIVKKAYDNDIKIIALTDHNTIAGYKKYLELKKEVALKLQSKIEECKGKISKSCEELQEQSNVLNSVLVLPGIEFEVRNCIHMLIIFNPKVQLDLLEGFLYDGGYRFELQGIDKPDISKVNWDIKSLYDEITKYDCLCFDAHTDSNKGIWNQLDNSIRALALSSPQLNGICYHNENQRMNIQSIYKQPAYKRQKEISFLKFSDSHQSEDVGSVYTWFRLKEISYNSLKEAFNNPTEAISTIQPDIYNILNKLVNEERCIFVDNYSENTYDEIANSICGLFNTDGGYCVIGVNKKKALIGFEYIEISDLFNSFSEQILDRIDYARGSEMYLTPYQLDNKKTILSIKVEPSNKIVHKVKSDTVYCINHNEVIVADLDFICNHVEKNTIVYVQDFSLQKLSNIEEEIFKLKHLYKYIQVINKYINIGKRLVDNFVIENTNNPSDLPQNIIGRIESIRQNYRYLNGSDNGKYILIDENTKPRLDSAYLRLLPPTYKQKKYSKTCNLKANTIVIVPGGGTYYIEKDSILISKSNSDVITISMPVGIETSNETMKFIAMFLKSSFCLWFVYNQTNSFNLWTENSYKSVILPYLDTNKLSQRLNISLSIFLANKIIVAEKEFLNDINNLDDSFDDESLSCKINDHNSKMEELFYMNDQCIYNCIGLSLEEVIGIEEFLERMQIYLPKEKQSIIDKYNNMIKTKLREIEGKK